MIAGASTDAPKPHPEAFPKSRRVLKRRDFVRIQHQGLRIYGSRLIFQFTPNRAPRVRLGLTVSKKIGNAVVRNRIKRWLREAFRRQVDIPGAPPHGAPNFDVVITPKRGVTDFSAAVLREELAAVVARYLQQRKGGHRPARRKGPGGHEPGQARR